MLFTLKLTETVCTCMTSPCEASHTGFNQCYTSILMNENYTKTEFTIHAFWRLIEQI